MAKSSQSVPTIQIDTTPLRDVARILRKISPAAASHMRSGLREVGTVVADRAKENARGFPRIHESTDRIEGSIRVQQSSGSIRVVAGGDGAPEAAPLEHSGQGGSFRHPLFGNQDVWVQQTAHPFLAPAADAVAPEIEQRLLAVIDASLREVGFET